MAMENLKGLVLMSAVDREIWDKKWEIIKQSSLVVTRASMSSRWKKITERVKKHFGSFKDLNVVELGSGSGVESLLTALQGANVTLVDYSKTALTRAKALFSSYNLNPICCNQSIFNLDDRFFSSFDISMSFGLVEHFLKNPERERAIAIHCDVLRKRGVSFISVPNEKCPHYRVSSQIGKMIVKHHIGLRLLHTKEKPFTNDELIMHGKSAGFKHIEIFGSSFLDFSYNPLLSSLKLGNVSLRFLDDHLAYALILFGIKY
jgi:2-polyprenyl-3-methyl-5-hydroxy-6-metoxy-1,4-benzoquinol methylase